MTLYSPQNKSPQEMERFRASLKEHNAKYAEIEKRGCITAMPEIFFTAIFTPNRRKLTPDENALLAKHNDELLTVLDEIRISDRFRAWRLRRKYGLVTHWV